MKATKKVVTFLSALTILAAPAAGLCNNVYASEDVFEGTGDIPVTLYTDPTPGDAAEEAYWRGMSCDFYYDQFNSSQKALYDALDKASMYYLINDVDTGRGVYVDVSDISIKDDDAYNIMVIFKFANPQYFFYDASSWWWRNGDGGKLSGIELAVISEMQTGTKRASAKAKIKSVINEYVTAASKGSRPEDKENIVYRRMCEKIAYDYDHESAYDQSLYGGVLGLTVCTGYMKTFEAVMNLCGLDCSFVENGSHAWNIFKIHGYWYYVDVTWADQSWGVAYKYYNTNTPSEKVGSRYTSYLPSIKYDCLDQTDYNKYSSRYVTVGGTTYFIVSDLSSAGLKACAVYGSTTSLPSKITYNGKEYTVIGAAAGTAGWNRSGGSWYYVNSAGITLTGWQKIKDDWYYFDPISGLMKTGWLADGGKWYYLDPDSGAMARSWKQINNKWYYFTDDGAMVTGWKFSGGYYYYFDSEGAMVRGWKQVNGKWYFFNDEGVMQTGWKFSGGRYYYLGSDGAMVTGWKSVNGKWYYFNTDGTMATGWKSAGGKWYYLGSDGAMVTGWKQLGGKWYYLNTDGSMVTGKKNIGGKVYNFGSDGVWDGK
ncbi:hypothetical protein [Butyrivibrio sp. AE2032]|uniref:hypothetical protein n=1 Tax=Butyrivibrio sp. AE2032 TaxID=1458463 RepID=UPI000690399A|nr:hypothetical protein [Butyrivibrio sp. AE2032]